MSPELRPARGRAVVEGVPRREVGAELEQRLHGGALARLGRQVQGGHPLAVRRPAERSALVGVGAQLDEARIASTRPVAAAQASGVPR